MLKAFVFDFGGTLMYLDGNIEELVARGAKELKGFLKGKELGAAEEIVRDFLRERENQLSEETLIEYPAEETLGRVIRQHGYELGSKEILEGIKVFFGPEWEAWTLFPNSHRVLQHLKGRGFSLGLLSNATSHWLIVSLVERFELGEYFDVIATSAELRKRKPARETFEYVLKRLGCEAQDVVMVGDRLKADIVGAQVLGMETILVTMKEPFENDLYRGEIVPDVAVGSLFDIVEMVEGA